MSTKYQQDKEAPVASPLLLILFICETLSSPAPPRTSPHLPAPACLSSGTGQIHSRYKMILRPQAASRTIRLSRPQHLSSSTVYIYYIYIINVVAPTMNTLSHPFQSYLTHCCQRFQLYHLPHRQHNTYNLLPVRASRRSNINIYVY